MRGDRDRRDVGNRPPLSDDAPFEEWRRRHAEDSSTNLLDLYELVARARGVAPHELPIADRTGLFKRAAPVMYPGFELTTNSERGLEPIEIVPYDPEWPRRFEEWRAKLAAALGPVARRIDHYGSTSVPGLAAKPVIDIHIGVDDMTREEQYVPPIEALGVQLRNRDGDQRFFRPFAGRPRDVHIHVCDVDSAWARKDLLFAAYLREDAAAREEYLRGKEQAAARWADDRVAYTEAKTAVILPILARAEQWARGTGWKP